MDSIPRTPYSQRHAMLIIHINEQLASDRIHKSGLMHISLARDSPLHSQGIDLDESRPSVVSLSELENIKQLNFLVDINKPCSD